jgi:predicted kinase
MTQTPKVPSAVVLMGLPLAGKTTWIDQNIDGSFLRISADQIKEAHPDYAPDRAYELHQYSVKVAEENLLRAAERQADMVVDSGSINNSYTKRLLGTLRRCGYHIKLVHIRTPLMVCLDRNEARERKVPAEDIVGKSCRESTQFKALAGMVDETQIVSYFTNEHIFIDMDGVLAAQTTLPRINGEIDFVNSQVFLNQEPVEPVILKAREISNAGRVLYILSGAPTSISISEKMQWLDWHADFIPHERRFFVNQGRHKAEMLEGLRKKFKLDKRQVTLVDDMHATLYDVLNRRMNPMHVSEFLTHKFSN